MLLFLINASQSLAPLQVYISHILSSMLEAMIQNLLFGKHASPVSLLSEIGLSLLSSEENAHCSAILSM